MIKLVIACPGCGMKFGILLDSAWKQARCPSCQKRVKNPGSYIVPTEEELTGVSGNSTQPKNSVLQRPRLQELSKKEDRGQFLPWFRNLSQYPFRSGLFVLVLAGSCILLMISGHREPPFFYVVAGLVGIGIASSSFLADRMVADRVLAVLTTCTIWNMVLYFCRWKFLCVFVSYFICVFDLFGGANLISELSIGDWFSMFWWFLKMIVVPLVLSTVIVFFIFRFGFFRPAAVCFLVFCLTIPFSQKIYQYIKESREMFVMQGEEVSHQKICRVYYNNSPVDTSFLFRA